MNIGNTYSIHHAKESMFLKIRISKHWVYSKYFSHTIGTFNLYSHVYRKTPSADSLRKYSESLEYFCYNFIWLSVCTPLPLFEPAHEIMDLSHKRPAKAQASLCIHAVLPEPSLFAHIKYGNRRKGRPKIRHLAPLDGCACKFEEWVYGGRKVP